MSARIVFDLDGTLIDSAYDIQSVANQVLELRSIEPVTIEETRSFIGEGTPRLIEQIRKARSISDRDQDKMLEDFMKLYPDAVHQTTMYEGVEDVLKRLLSQNFKMGICTNKPYTPTIAILKHLKLEKYFDVVTGGDTYPERKPDPQPLINCMNKLGEGTQLYVGDSITDAKAAASASIPFILFLQGYTNSDIDDLKSVATFEKFSDLPGIIDSILCH